MTAPKPSPVVPRSGEEIMQAKVLVATLAAANAENERLRRERDAFKNGGAATYRQCRSELLMTYEVINDFEDLFLRQNQENERLRKEVAYCRAMVAKANDTLGEVMRFQASGEAQEARERLVRTMRGELEDMRLRAVAAERDLGIAQDRANAEYVRRVDAERERDGLRLGIKRQAARVQRLSCRVLDEMHTKDLACEEMLREREKLRAAERDLWQIGPALLHVLQAKGPLMVSEAEYADLLALARKHAGENGEKEGA